MAKAKKTNKKTTVKKAKKTTAIKPTFVSFVLDETGSMGCVKAQTIMGFNEYVKGLQKEAKKTSFTLTKFNTGHVTVVHDAIKLADVVNLSEETYVPNNGTPLYDAIGKTIRAAEAKCGKDDVIIAIMTDGQENSSVEFTRDAIFKLIKEKQETGWVFMFLGANQDAYAGGLSLGIAANNTVVFNAVNTVAVMQDVSHIHSSYTTKGAVERSVLSMNLISEDHVKENETLYSRPKAKKREEIV